ncbi:MAG: ATP-dependent helicase [Candidatus Andersenbacteria bacterium]|nr:ATP-dependent helicase [Candidatus Andersenbacteria bacterium]
MSLFEERYEKLNKEQKEAVDNIDGPMLVVAGPGSGKTELLSLRVANILQKTDVFPSNILCLTFTEAAATNMRNRLSGIIGQDAYGVAIHTFHSFGSEIINQNPEYFYQGAIFNPADDLAQVEIIEEILGGLKHNSLLKSYNPEQGYTYMKDILERIKNLKEALTPDEFLEITLENKSFFQNSEDIIDKYFSQTISKKKLPAFKKIISELEKIEFKKRKINIKLKNAKESLISNLNEAIKRSIEEEKTSYLSEWKKNYTMNNKEKKRTLKDFHQIEKQIELAKIYKEYQKKLKEKGYYDFSDMLSDTVQALEKNPELKYNIAEKYLYILVDEFQDTNNIQNRLLDNIINLEVNKDIPNILAVGDDDQAIYKFQGANIKNIINFIEKYKDLRLVVLKKNYRSTQEILDLARKTILIGNERLENKISGITKDLVSGNSTIKSGDIINKEFETSFHEMVWLAKEVKKKIEDEKLEAKDITVIAPKHKILQEIAKVFDFFNIPVSYEKKKNILEDKQIKEIITIFKFINTLNDVNEKEADEFLPEILSFSFLQVNSIVVWKISVKAYNERKRWLEIMMEYEDEKIRNIAEFLIALGNKANDLTAEEIIDIITGVKSLKECDFNSPYKEYYFNKKKFDRQRSVYLDYLTSLHSFIDSIRQYKGHETLSVKDVVNFVNLHQTHHIPLNVVSEFNDEKRSVNLITAHGAKGLEFDTVFLMDCSDDLWMKNNNGRLNFPLNIDLAPQKDSVDDKLRLFYVAITRAKRNLYITNYKYNNKGQEKIRLRFLNFTDEKETKSLDQRPKLTIKQNRSVEEIKSGQASFAKKEDLEDLIELKLQINNHTIQNADKKDLLKKLLKNYKLSVTHLNSFLNIERGGPQEFLEKQLLKFPQAQNKNSAYGSAVHNAFNIFYSEFKQRKKVPELNLFLKIFEDSLRRQRLNKNDFKEMLEKGQDELSFYYQKKKDMFDYNDYCELDFKSQGVNINGADITGKLDRIHINKEDNDIEVYDYKTGKPFERWDVSELYGKIHSWEYKNQLVFYKLLVENSRDFGKYTVNTGILEFIRPESDNLVELSLSIQKEDLERLKKLIQVVYGKIQDLDFPSVESYSKDMKGIKKFEDDLLDGKI